MSTLNILSPCDRYKDKENHYIELRTLENRVRTIEEIIILPEVSSHSSYAKEWLWRKRSMESLVKYLSKTKTNKIILELGCGNGWLANHLSKIDDSIVYALDLNWFELQQGQEAFKQDNLHFAYGDIFEDIFPGKQFDYIVLAASVQYFPSLSRLIARLRELLTDCGEIHIVDSNFYSNDKIDQARQSSLDYFKNLNMEEMSQYYFHHSLEELNKLNSIQLNRSIHNNIEMFMAKYLNLGSYHIFPWFMLKK